MDDQLSQVARNLVAGGRGVFAADASPKTLGKRAQEIGLSLDTLEARLAYRAMTLATDGLGQYIGGVILHEEALSLIPELTKQNILPGVKVDQGTAEMQPGSIEKITQGLTDLPQRLEMYQYQGAKFTKWRAVLTITSQTPTAQNIDSNAAALASFARLSQEAGLVPIVEPEILMEGDHTSDRCADVTRLVGKKVFAALLEQEVDLSAMLYKPNMIVAGKNCPSQPSLSQVAEKTVGVMQEIVAAKLPGIVFLSGGQEAILATQRLNEIAKLGAGTPWRRSFSFERALEGPAMQVWAGKDENVSLAQQVLLHRAKCNSLASVGQYTMEVENNEI